MKYTSILSWIIYCMLAVNPVFAADAGAGKLKAMLCANCHGVDGNSVSPQYPKLAGQLEAYIVKQTLDFRLGNRTDSVMSNMINLIPEIDDLQDIAAYFSSLPVMQGTGEKNAMTEKGEKIYQGRSCHYCHSKSSIPIFGTFSSLPPVIEGQHKEYIMKALKDVKEGRRKADVYGLMYKMLQDLTDEDIEAIASYLSSLQLTAPEPAATSPKATTESG